MSDPDFCASYTVVRTKGKWIKGRFTLGAPANLNFFGPVQPATDKELQQIPEGDRSQGIMKFMCAPPKKIYITQTKPESGDTGIYVSDQVIYMGELYKIIKVKPWIANGFLRAFGVCIGTV